MSLRERFQALSGRERNLIIVAVLTAVVVLVYYGGAGTFSSAPVEDEDALWIKHQKILNYRRVVSRGQATGKRRIELEQHYREQQARLMGGATPTQVGAELQGLLSEFAGAAALNVLSSQILREEEKHGYRRVGVRMTLSGSLEGVTRLLGSVEGAEYDLVVSHLEINRKLSSARRSSASRSATMQSSPLTVSVEVKTFMREES